MPKVGWVTKLVPLGVWVARRRVRKVLLLLANGRGRHGVCVLRHAWMALHLCAHVGREEPHLAHHAVTHHVGLACWFDLARTDQSARGHHLGRERGRREGGGGRQGGRELGSWVFTDESGRGTRAAVASLCISSEVVTTSKL